MRAYSLDLRRYVSKVHKGEDLAPRRAPGKRRTLDEGAMRLLESDLEERPAVTLAHRRTFLERVVGAQVSESTTSRAIKRLGWSRKKDRWVPQNVTSS
jgi:transposase